MIIIITMIDVDDDVKASSRQKGNGYCRSARCSKNNQSDCGGRESGVR
jgi:hypothetical protein